MIIAVDFDGTIVEHEYPKIGKPIPFAIETLKMLQKDPEFRLILWSVREGALLQDAIDYCESKGLKFYAANKNYPEEEAPTPRKLNADLFIDDRNLGGLPEWGIIYKLIQAGGDTLYNFEELIHGAKESGKKRKKNFFLRIGEAIDRQQGNRY
ncbi:MAG: hypothetical protein LBI82_08425 [Dysgonamonadaceae bacterium]|jgi:hypothetical protein|nr:hypothetical protein [Dysgonamonadaceae bacterium]